MITKPILMALPDAFIGARVCVRRYIDGDAVVLHRALQEAREHLQPWLPGFGHPWSYEQVLESIRRGQAQWALRESFTMGMWTRESEVFLGDMRLRPTTWSIPAFDLSYWIHPSAQGQGYISEAVQLLTAVAFETLHAQRVAIACEPRNERSRRVAERLGFVREGCFRNVDYGPDGTPCDLLIYALVPDDFARVRALWTRW
jgi:RimJ/RimL family protein N-acetyltransferase